VALVVIPEFTPTVEPLIYDIEDQLQQNLGQALNIVEARHEAAGHRTLTLRVPAEYAEAVITDYTIITNWPTLTVTGSYIRSAGAYEQLGAGEWLSTLQIEYFEQDQNQQNNGSDLAMKLSRVAEAVWMVLINADENKLVGADLLKDSIDIEQAEPAGGTLLSRSVRLGMNYKFRT
jgi:hypothetical protein